MDEFQMTKGSWCYKHKAKKTLYCLLLLVFFNELCGSMVFCVVCIRRCGTVSFTPRTTFYSPNHLHLNNTNTQSQTQRRKGTLRPTKNEPPLPKPSHHSPPRLLLLHPKSSASSPAPTPVANYPLARCSTPFSPPWITTLFFSSATPIPTWSECGATMSR